MVTCSGQKEEEVQEKDIRAEPIYCSVLSQRRRISRRKYYSVDRYFHKLTDTVKNRNLEKIVGFGDWMLKDQCRSSLPGGQWSTWIIVSRVSLLEDHRSEGLLPALGCG